MAEKSLIEKLKEAILPESKVKEVDDMIDDSHKQRVRWERLSYNNNFFYDGEHFKSVSATTGRILDYAATSTDTNPKRSIPKAAKQVDGINNLLVAHDPQWAVYPRRIDADPESEVYEAEKEEAQLEARRTGHYLETMFDKLQLRTKLPHIVHLYLKNPVAYYQVTYDEIKECISGSIYDFFDLYLANSVLDNLDDQAYIIKTVQKTVAELRANEAYQNTDKIVADGKYSASQVKESYIKSSFGELAKDLDTVILKEAWIKKYVTEEMLSENADAPAFEGKEEGDPIYLVRTVAGGQLLREEYVENHPFVAFRYSEGPLYKRAPIERFISSNRSLDLIVSRIERWAFRMAKGHWLRRKNESFKTITDESGEIIEYENVAPTQGDVKPLPSTLQNHVQFLERDIEEGGVTTSILSKTPEGVKAGVAIESLKESEYANFKNPSELLAESLQEVASKILALADRYISSPKTVYHGDETNPDYFDIIGASAEKNYEDAESPLAGNVVRIRKDAKVVVRIEGGMAYTEQGKRVMIMDLANGGFVPKEWVLKQLKVGGNVAEILAQLEAEQGQPMAPQQLEQIKVALLQVIADLQKQGGGQMPAVPAMPAGGGGG